MWAGRALKLGLVVAFLAWSVTPPQTAREGEGGKLHLDRASLEHPRYAPLVEFLNFILGPYAKSLIPLDADAIIARAKAAEGLDDLWHQEDYWRGGLDALIKSADNDCPGIGFVGRVLLRVTIEQNLRTQLRVVNLTKHHPEILERPVSRPVILAGLPRTGSTHLHRLLGERLPDLQYLPLFEAMDPVAPTGLPAADIGTDRDPRVSQTDITVKILHWFMPLFPMMQRMGTYIAFEELQLGAFVFGSQLFEVTYFGAESYGDWWLKTDHTPAYQFIRTCLQVMQWQRVDARRWVLKTPQNAEQLAAVLAVFPDAMVVATHRDPTPVLKSTCAMTAYTYRMQNMKIDTHAVGKYWRHRLVMWAKKLSEVLPGVPEERVFHVHFKDFMRDQVGTVGRIAQWAGLSWNASVEAEVRAHVDANPRGGSVKFEYRLETFGLREEDVRGEFDFYNKQFSIVS